MRNPIELPLEYRNIHEHENEYVQTSHNRLFVMGVVMTLIFVVISCRLVNLTIVENDQKSTKYSTNSQKVESISRADILDRNGVVLATTLPTVSLFADPKKILNLEEVVKQSGWQDLIR